MTKQEAICQIKDRMKTLKFEGRRRGSVYFAEALIEAIKALEHEPCEDCISRQQANNEFSDYEDSDGIKAKYVRQSINELPPVQPIRPKGKWVLQRHGLYDDDIHTGCSCCCYTPDRDIHSHIELIHGGGYTQKPYRPNFCPNCGADMRGGEE